MLHNSTGNGGEGRSVECNNSVIPNNGMRVHYALCAVQTERATNAVVQSIYFKIRYDPKKIATESFSTVLYSAII